VQLESGRWQLIRWLCVHVILETCLSAMNEQSDEPAAPSTPRETVLDNSQCRSPFSPCDSQDKRGSRRLRFVDAVTSAK